MINHQKKIPLSVPSLRGNELKYVTECIETEWVSSVGSYVNRFEEAIASFLGISSAVACVNGTAALHLAMILCNVQQNDEVIVPTITFIAPANAVRYVGAEPVFLDCDEKLNIDPQKLEDCLKECYTKAPQGATGVINKKTGRCLKAIVVVHVFGHPVDIEPIRKLADLYQLKIIEDATESLGSFYSSLQGKKYMAGTVGDVACLSFNGNKIITTGGGGMLLTHDKTLAEKARHLSTQAKSDPLYYDHDMVGFNYRLTNIQAALGVAQMEQLESFVRIKRENFYKYQELLQDIKGLSLIEEPAYAKSNYWHYALIVDDPERAQLRDHLVKSLRVQGIEVRPLWRPNHLQKPYHHSFAYEPTRALWYGDRVLNLPCSVSLTDDDIHHVATTIRGLYGNA
ncbi:MAG: hypothetical protein A3I05_02955 [Deltaproteobacteria bacterium RIFCSPLOWO2_02_FULL_44_10]|nr:MAG: hypothetical protein A3C46_05725 [Deltaproteobacteria bacterium RIFCSPHIGHO2_02_FULL_44_16]OGQ45086.1 MAG: hypothetical protein A3I05_02955 [Deltaproteobacteria bacterium RIFCSPLOWO2_02_FULL_44_10]